MVFHRFFVAVIYSKRARKHRHFTICPFGKMHLPFWAYPFAPQGKPIPNNNTYNNPYTKECVA